MDLYDDQVEFQLDRYRRGKPGTIPDPRVARMVDGFRRAVLQRFVSLRPTLLGHLKRGDAAVSRVDFNIGDTLLTSVKVDGEGAFLVFDEDEPGEKCYLCSAVNHRTWTGLPVLDDAVALARKRGIRQVIVAGELHASGSSPPEFEGRSRLASIAHYARNPGSIEDLERIGFKAFDILELNGENLLGRTYADRWKGIDKIFPDGGRLAKVRTQVLRARDTWDFYQQVVEEGGHEGIVIRDANTDRGYKVKPVHTLDAVIIGAVEGVEGSRVAPGMLASALVALRYPDGVYQILGNVGGGLSDDQRRDAWLRVEFTPSPGFVAATADGRAFRMVKPVLVAEIEFLELVAMTYDDKPVYQNTLVFDDGAGKWEVLRPLPFPKMISPRFVKDHPFREDKTTSVHDVRVAQVDGLVDMTFSSGVQRVDLPASEVTCRYVFANGDNVRKVVAWKTNKDQVDPSYPAHVVFMTDYSAKRKDPLQRKVQVTASPDQALALVDRWIDTEILDKTGTKYKRGWSLVDKKDDRLYPRALPG